MVLLLLLLMMMMMTTRMMMMMMMMLMMMMMMMMVMMITVSQIAEQCLHVFTIKAKRQTGTAVPMHFQCVLKSACLYIFCRPSSRKEQRRFVQEPQQMGMQLEALERQ